MEKLSPRQLILTVLVISLATSLLVSLVTVSALIGIRPSEIVERILGRTAPASPNGPEIAERVLRQDELVVSVVKRVSPAVVSIVATRDVPVIEQFFINPFQGDPFLERFFGGGQFQIPQFRQRGTEERQVGAGTGFVVAEDGLILTNRHVVADTNADYTVLFNDGAKVPVSTIVRDPVQDLAVIQVKRGIKLVAVPLGDSAKIEIGQTVIAIGNALGQFSNTVSVGVISGLRRNVVAGGGAGGPEQLAELIQTDAAINLGNSGGPLLNLRGEVIGINVAMAQGAENIGFAIPIAKARRDIESVKATGRIVYPFLGIRYVIVTTELAAKEKLPVEYGALLIGDDEGPAVVKGSPAEKAGLKERDIILEFNGERIEPSRTLASLIQKYKVGDTVTLEVQRGEETLTVSAILEERK